MQANCDFCNKTLVKALKCGRCGLAYYCGKFFLLINECNLGFLELALNFTGLDCQKEDWPVHKEWCKRPNYILRVDLLPELIQNPRITRTLSCPATATFAEFHNVLQVAFGWADTHPYEFRVFEHNDEKETKDDHLHKQPTLEIADMGTVEGVEVDLSKKDCSMITIFQALDDPTTKKKTIHYLYDSVNGWDHVITYKGRTGATTQFICVDGEGHGCAEDVGGPSGWNELLVAYDASNRSPAHFENIMWFENDAINMDSKGLGRDRKLEWDREKINQILADFNTPAGSASSSYGSPYSVLLISLLKQPFFVEMYSATLAKLSSKADSAEVTQMARTIKHLSMPYRYNAVILTDPWIIDRGSTAIRQKLVEYVRAGGTVIFGFYCSSFVTPSNLTRFFNKTWSFTWESGDYCRKMFSQNRQANPTLLRRRSPELPEQYSMKALHLNGIAPGDRVNVSTDSDQGPAVFSKYGKGYLGWSGDVNTEHGTTELLLTMCGVYTDSV
jgi:hypothetical protein